MYGFFSGALYYDRDSFKKEFIYYFFKKSLLEIKMSNNRTSHNDKINFLKSKSKQLNIDFNYDLPLTMITCYDYPTAKILKDSEIDLILVGDSLGEVVWGFQNTTFVNIDLMCFHIAAVKRGLGDCKHIVGDMPFASYNYPIDALNNARKLINAGADSVKLEIPSKEVMLKLKTENIPFFGHVGLTPQTIQNYKKQGTSKKSAQKIIKQSLEIDQLGALGIILEAIPSTLASEITSLLACPTIGIAAGQKCNGQVLVLHDLVGYEKTERKYLKKKADCYNEILSAVNDYHFEVKK